MQDGKGGRPRAADDDGRAAKIDAGPFQIGHAALAVGVVGDKGPVLVHEHVGPVGERGRGGPHIGGSERLGFIGRGDVDGKEVASRKERLGLGHRRHIHETVMPGQPRLLIDGVVHDRRFRMAHRVPQHIQLLAHSDSLPVSREAPSTPRCARPARSGEGRFLVRGAPRTARLAFRDIDRRLRLAISQNSPLDVARAGVWGRSCSTSGWHIGLHARQMGSQHIGRQLIANDDRVGGGSQSCAGPRETPAAAALRPWPRWAAQLAGEPVHIGMPVVREQTEAHPGLPRPAEPHPHIARHASRIPGAHGIVNVEQHMESPHPSKSRSISMALMREK